MAVDTIYSTLRGYVTSGVIFAGEEGLASAARILLNKDNTVVFDTDTSGNLRFPSTTKTITIGTSITINPLTGDISSPGGILTIGSLAIDSLTVATTFVANGTATFAGPAIFTPQSLSGAGAVNVTTATTKVTTTGNAQALTLANGTDGQIKTIIHDVDGGSFVLTPTTKTGFSTITSTAAGESATLQYVTTRGWIILALFGAVAA